jgi:hypothetical protein
VKALAEFAMRGRLQALLVTVAGAASLLFCWVSAAVLALVTLRKGPGAGGWLLLWAVLPAGVMAFAFGDSGPLALLSGVMVLALVLRITVSLPLAVLAGVPVGVCTGLGLLAFGGEYLEQIADYLGDFIATLERQLSEGGAPVPLARPEPLQIAGMLGAGTAMSSVLCLLLARYWQAALYNPGGFGEEFRALYYPPAVSGALLVAAVGLFGLGPQYRTWAMICALPLTFAGLALVHARAAWRGRGRGWLTGFYLAWLLLDPVKLLVVVAALIDSWKRFRQHWSTGAGGRDREDE